MFHSSGRTELRLALSPRLVVGIPLAVRDSTAVEHAHEQQNDGQHAGEDGEDPHTLGVVVNWRAPDHTARAVPSPTCTHSNV